MSEPDDSRHAQQIAARLSLRGPQRTSLDILADLLGRLPLTQDADLAAWRDAVRATPGIDPRFADFERKFPSLAFALATGVGKTRLMGAMIAWLLVTGRSRHFLVLAPNLTIYEKLKRDFTPGSPKYVFTGIPQIAQTPPVIVTGDDYAEGRGVRLDFARPGTKSGELFDPQDAAPHINIFNIAKINTRGDTKPGAVKTATPRVRRFQEYLGGSYFDYLAGLPDLVVLMDEAHRYYASAGAKAIDDLRPVLGLELTATPKTAGANSRALRNVIVDYPLARARADGYVKEPAVATREDFDPAGVDPAELERIKLEDGIHHHEFVKIELENYARANAVQVVKPFVLVVAQDVEHARAIKARIEHEDFFGGRYRGRVIEVHSALAGDESDESTARLLAVEHDATTEVVIHVNKLKEGWDVTNLYTIVPLRTSASEILTEQTIGRGLRLPYGRRTGVAAVDRLTIVAHDRFKEIVDRAQAPDSILRERIVIGDGAGADVPLSRPRVLAIPSRVEMELTGRQATLDDVGLAAPNSGLGPGPSGQRSPPAPFADEAARTIAATTLAVIAERPWSSAGALREPEVQAQIAGRVHERLQTDAGQSALPGLGVQELRDDRLTVASIVARVAQRVAETTIAIPNVVVVPDREVTYGFDDFDLEGLERIHYQPADQDLLVQQLADGRRERIARAVDANAAEARLEDHLVRQLLSRDEIDYDRHAVLLYKLAGQVVARLRAYLPDEGAVRETLVAWERPLADFIWVQMQPRHRPIEANYIGRVTEGFEALRPLSLTLAASESPRPLRAPLPAGVSIRQLVFDGLEKCCYPYQKFDSDLGERSLAVLLEDDPAVRKWMKPAPGQFRIEWKPGRAYEPDFVAELDDRILIIEPKRASELDDPEVKDKAKAALQWCVHAREHAARTNGKPWYYLLVPHDAILRNGTVAGLEARFRQE